MGNLLFAYKNHIKTNYPFIILSINRKEILSGFYNPGLFFWINTVGKAVYTVFRPCFNFYKNQGLTVQGNYVYFTGFGAIVSFADLIAFVLQEFFGFLLAKHS